MKLVLRLSLLLPVLLFACASEPPKPVEPVIVAPPPPAPLPDSISGKVVSDEGVAPLHIAVKLLLNHEEISSQPADENGGFKFDAPLEKGKYELTAHSGALHGTRAFTYTGGELKDVNLVIAKSEPRHHHRHHRHSDD